MPTSKHSGPHPDLTKLTVPIRAARSDVQPDSGLIVRGLIVDAGSFRLGPVDLAVPPGRILVVLGPSGAGKTMLLESISGLRPRHSGQIRLAGVGQQKLVGSEIADRPHPRQQQRGPSLFPVRRYPQECVSQ